MVRRRARATKTAEVGSCSGALLVNDVGVKMTNGSSIEEDQHFASPKRKDCKIDNADGGAKSLSLPKIEENSAIDSKLNPSSIPSKAKSDRNGITGKTIGVPLATRSQTRTIENFFKANIAAKNAKLKEKQDNDMSESKAISLPTKDTPSFSSTELFIDDECIEQRAQASPQQQMIDFVCELSEDTNDTDNTELSDCTNHGLMNKSNFAIQRISHCSQGNASDNIFLQAPVLTLDVDKSPNQASSIVIKKSLEIEPVFSSPPNLVASPLNGLYNQIVSLKGSFPKRESFGFETKPATTGNDGSMLTDNDNSSCDSGIVFGNSPESNCSSIAQSVSTLVAQNRRRKPTTPHRILCPSPIKTNSSPPGSLGNSPSSNRNDFGPKDPLVSPRKSHRYLTAANSKSRRRLNQLKEQTTYSSPKIMTSAGCHNNYNMVKINTNNSDDATGEEFENLEDVQKDICRNISNGFTSATTKSMFDSAKHPPIVQQQNNANNKSIYNNNIRGYSNNIKSNTHDMHLTKFPQSKTKSNIIKTLPKTKHQASQPLATTNGNREMPEFFPVRRSVRKTKTAVKEEMMRNLEKAILEERAEGLKVAHFEGKGRGVVADCRFQRGEFVVEYIGDLITMTEAAEREQGYALDENAGCYMYYFKHKNQQYCIDATADTGKLGRLVNHSRNGNLITKVVVVKQRPHLILIAKDDIEPGEELTYDYGDRSKESLLHHPWLAF